jgi:hypothetical protein
MARFVYRPGHSEADEFGMVDASIAPSRNSGNDAPHVISDTMDSTRHMADGKFYDSKARFREATKAAGCIEVGNELKTLTQPRKSIPLSREQRRNEIRRVVRQLQGY